MGLIYKATHIESGRVYIGQTMKSMKDRRKAICNPMYGPKTLIEKAIKEFGEMAFEWEIIENEINDPESLDEREVFYIEKFKSMNIKYGFNTRPGGGLSLRRFGLIKIPHTKRLSVSMPIVAYKRIVQMAKKEKRSVAWMVADILLDAMIEAEKRESKKA